MIRILLLVLLHVLLVVSSSHYQLIVFLLFLFLGLVKVIVDHEFFEEIILSSSEWNEPVSFESIIAATSALLPINA